MGRTIPPEDAFALGRYARPDLARRREVLRDTVARLTDASGPDWHALAAENLARWREQARDSPVARFEVMAGDWGEVTAALTKQHGRTFAVLNMANAYKPGGAYVEGTAAQEENMFRRTDCHLAVESEQMNPLTERYRPQWSALLNGDRGRVYLDTEQARVCVRGPEDRQREDMGYAWLAPEEVFPFYELRAAAYDLPRGERFDVGLARAKICAQLDTLVDADCRYAVLSAFGCGAFHNPADVVATLYRQELGEREDAFERVVFAIFNPGYGPDNFTPFAEEFDPSFV